MDRARLKTFILLLLILTNLTFLSLLGIDALQRTRQESETRTVLVSTLTGMGVSITYDQLPASDEQALYFLSRNLETEARIAQALLGDTVHAHDEGGGIWHYQSGESRGEALFRSGAFRFQIDSQHLTQDAIGNLLGRLELRTRGQTTPEADSAVRHSYTLLHGIYPIVNGQVAFVFSEGYLQEITGTALWGEVQRYLGGAQQDVTTALISLAGHLAAEGGVSRFESVEMGYYLSEGTGLLELRPVWIIQTDNGIFSVDRQSGEIRQ